MNGPETQHARNIVSKPEKHLGGEHLHTSTRVLLDSATPPKCDHCEDAISHGTRYKCITVRDQTGSVTELSFCSEECVLSRRDQPAEPPAPSQ